MSDFNTIGDFQGGGVPRVIRLAERCVSCTACVPHCPAGALVVDRDDWVVRYDYGDCVGRRACVDICIYRAVARADS